MYGDFAQVYDVLMDDVDYDAWARYYLQLMAPCAPKRICECACGTGSLTVRFAQAGLQVTGVDLSEDMLRVAAEKARQSGVLAAFVRQDMCKLALPRKVDAVLATCDGVNYLTHEGQAREFFERAHDALRAGGRLCFDLSSREKLEGTLGNAFFGEEREDIAYLWQNTYDAQTKKTQMDVTFFVREEDGRYRRFDEVHMQRAYAVAEIVTLLEESGFSQIGVYGNLTMEPPKPGDERIHFCAVKG